MKRFAIAAVALSLTACINVGVKVTDEQAAQFKKGESTEAEVIAKLGAPTGRLSSATGHQLWYSAVHAQARPASYIPIVGPLVGGADSSSSTVMFLFDPDGKLKDVISQQSQIGGTTGIQGAQAPTSGDQPR